jgi:glycosyltransferase involved in cell wall biosynthesis
MHLGFDLLFLEPGRSGGRETHARELLRALRNVDPRLRVTTFCNRETADAGTGWWTDLADRAVVLGRAQVGSRAAWAIGELAGLPLAASRARVDLLHSPANLGPVGGGRFARVLTVHDVLWRMLPDTVSPAMRLGTQVLLPTAAMRAQRVITVSQASREDLIAHLRLPRDRIDVVPNGLTRAQQPGDAARARARLEARDRPIALAVATDLPHKDLGMVVAAVAELPAGERPLLAIAGQGTDTGDLAGFAAAQDVPDDVRLLGAVGTAELEDLYAAAAVLVTATRYEGFGLPVLEAMARGVPVVCTDLPVLREVAGDVARYVPARDPQALADALRETLNDGPGVQRRVEAGQARAATFTWEAAAKATRDVYDRALSAMTKMRFA